MNTKRANVLLVLFLFLGTIFAWSNVYLSFSRFYEFEATVLKLRGCVVSNPILTPCFWGAVAFAVSLVWSLYLYRISEYIRLVSHIQRIIWLLVGSVVFAWGNVAYEVYSYLGVDTGGLETCTGVVDAPWQSPCFFGAIIFSTSLVSAWYLKKTLNKKH